jgi:caspase domain-containing protein
MMILRGLAAGLFAGALACGSLHAQGCPVSKDLVVRALELVSENPSRDDLTNGILLLKQAEEACDENGDAWYYRSLFERKLGQGNPQYSLGKARERRSDALRDGEDPFRLSTPSTRGVRLAQSSQEIRNAGVAQKWALVVGVSNFRDPHLNLKYTGKDAISMAALLKDPALGRFAPDHVKLIQDSEATTINVKAGINWLARQAGENDLVVIYIATHGTARDQDTAGVNYMVTFDTDVKSQDGLFSTSISLEDVSLAIRTRIRALHTVLFLDTCHSQGALSQTVLVPSSISPRMLNQIREGTGRIIIGASQLDESSYESPKYGHGLFTYYLLEGLRTQKDATLDKVFDYVKSHVTQDAASNGWKQHPFFDASDAVAPVILGVVPSS